MPQLTCWVEYSEKLISELILYGYVKTEIKSLDAVN